MDCVIKYNNEGLVTDVMNKEGKPSTIFQELVTIPTIEVNEAVALTKATFSEKFRGDGTLVEYAADNGAVFDNFQDAFAVSNKEVEILFDRESIAEISVNTNPDTKIGLLNNLNKQGLLDPEVDFVDGVKVYQALGGSDVRTAVSSAILNNTIRSNNLGKYRYKIKPDGSFTLEIRESIKDLTYDQIEQQYGKEVLKTKMAGDFAMELLNNHSGRFVSTINTMTEAQLKNQLEELLSQMGVKLMSIEEYKKNYKLRNGMDINAEAFADIANSVIVFQGEEIDTKTLREETIHFLIEGMDQAVIGEALEEVTSTPEYQEQSNRYREQYTKENPGKSAEEIETLVRKEMLAKAVTNELQAEKPSEGIITRFINSIKEFVRGLLVDTNTKGKMKKVTESIAQMIVTKNLTESINMEQIQQSDFLMYALATGQVGKITNEVNTELEKTLRMLEAQERLIRSNKNIGGTSKLKAIRRALAKIYNNIDVVKTQQAISELLDVTKTKIDYISEAMNNAESAERALNYEEHQIIAQLTDLYKNSLVTISGKIRKDPEMKVIYERVEDILKRINRVEAKQRSFNNNTVEKLVKKLVDRSPKAAELAATDGYDNFIKEMVEKVNIHNKDTGSMYMYYGQITHASDPLLNMLGVTFSDMVNDTERTYTDSFKRFLKQIGGYIGNVENLNELLKGGGDKEVSETNWEEFNKAIVNANVESHIEALKADKLIPTKEQEEKIRKYYDMSEEVDLLAENLELESSVVREVTYRDTFLEKTLYMTERIYKPEYYEDQLKVFKKLDLNPVTRAFLLDISQERGEIQSRGVDSNGNFIGTRELVNEEAKVREKRMMAENPFDTFGNQKDGLTLLTKMEAESLADPSVIEYEKDMFFKLEDNASDDAKIAYDLNKMKKDRLENGGNMYYNNESMSDFFLGRLKELEESGAKRKDIKSFVLNNLNINLAGEFWDDFKNATSNYKLAEDTISEMPDNEKADFVKLYKEKKALDIQRSAILKAYRDTKNSTNIRVLRMTSDVLETLKKLSDNISTIEDQMRQFKTYNNKVEAKEKFLKENAESTPTQEWYKIVNDNNIKYNEENVSEIYEVARKYMSANAIRYNGTLVDELISMASGRNVVLREKQLKKIEKLLGDKRTIDKGNAAEVAMKLIENSLDFYLTSTTPVGLNGLLNEIHKENGRPISEILDEISKIDNVVLSNHFTTYEGNESEFINEKYDRRQTGERYQANLSNPAFRNQAFMDKVGMKYDNEKGVIKDPNNNYQKAYDTYMEYKLKMMNLYEATSEMSLYDKINVRQTTFDSVSKAITGKKTKSIIKEYFKDFVSFRVDEMELGDTDTKGELIRNKTNMKTFPKPFVRKLEDSNTRTDDSLFAIATFSKAAHTFDSRTQYFGDIMALKNSIIDRGAIDGKDAESTNTYKMAQNYINSVLFGINETANRKVRVPLIGEVDIAKVISKLHSFVRWKNLSNNFVVPLTSYFTARIGLDIEYRTEQYVDKDSVKMARKRFNRSFLTAGKEAFSLESKNYLNVLGEHLGLFDFSARFENANKGKFARFLAKIGFGLHTAANFEPLSMAMMANLYGHRLYGKDFVDFNTYKKLVNKSDKEARASWATLENKTFAEYLKVEDGNVKYNIKKFKEDTGINSTGEAQSHFKEILTAVTNRGKKLVERIDGTIKSEERTMLQRNFFGKFIMTHKAWLAIALANKFKSKQFNFNTMMEEEGAYVTGFRKIGEAIGSAYNFARGKGGLNEVWANITGRNDEEYVRANMKRIGIETATASTLMLLAMFMSGYADDEEQADNYMAQFSAYMFLRMTNEQNSQQFGIGDEVYKTLKDPIVGLTQIGDIFNLKRLFSTKEVETGKHKGIPGYQAWLLDNYSPMKQFNQLRDSKNLKRQRNSYEYFNSKTDNQILAFLLSQEDVNNILR